ncbi:MAG: amidohydrolase [Candidatus Rokubacteria bacterium]|nr:amidohydrolase [Candidatus Rokubacteria bacterium]
MARDGFKVFDSDMHVLEPVDLWERYIDPAFKDRAPRGTTRKATDVGVTVDGEDAFKLSAQVARVSFPGGLDRFAEDIARGFDATAQLRAMDREGIDVTVLYPSRGLFVNSFPDMDPAFSEAIARAYNNWLADFCRAGDPRRMHGAAMLPIQDIGASIREARRAVRELGFRAVFLRPNPLRPGIYWNDPIFDPLWAGIQELGVPVGFHEGVASHLPTVGADRFGPGQFALQHACSHSIEQMLAVEAMTLGGVLERFPRLKVAFLEGNGSWLPFWLWRLDEHWENPGRYENPALTRKPSECFYRQCFVSLECDEVPARQAVELCGPDCFVFSTDYPHYDTKYPEATARFLKLPLTEESKRKILWDNCARLYGFTGG